MRLTHKQKLSIFICYRRSDSEAYADRLSWELMRRFGKQRIFMDIDTIRPGEDFLEVIEKAISSCDVLLAVIGRQWLSVGDGRSRRLDSAEDPVRLEIESALRRGIRIIPVLVQGAAMPRPEELPGSLSKLARRQASELSRRNWDEDIRRLIGDIEMTPPRVPPAEQERAPLTPPVGRASAVNKRLPVLVWWGLVPAAFLAFVLAITQLGYWPQTGGANVNNEPVQTSTPPPGNAYEPPVPTPSADTLTRRSVENLNATPTPLSTPRQRPTPEPGPTQSRAAEPETPEETRPVSRATPTPRNTLWRDLPAGPRPRNPLGPELPAGATPTPRSTLGRDLPARPSGTITLDIDPMTGLIAAPTCPVIRTKTFVIGTEPRRKCGPQYHPKGSIIPGNRN
jgi:hypothetical protein